MNIHDLILRIASTRYWQYVLSRKVKIAKWSKFLFTAIGGLFLLLSLGEIIGLLANTGSGQKGSLAIMFVFLSMLILLACGYVLLMQFPASWKVKFLQRKVKDSKQVVFGFWSLIAVGVGTTLGSPLFVLIPVNIIQYGFVTIISLILATFFSLGLSLVYSKSTAIMRKIGIEVVGGSSFVSGSIGIRNIRYFLSRFSAALANTALAAYSAVLFANFDLQLLPQFLGDSGITGTESTLIVIIVFLLLAGWLVVNLFFSNRFLKKIVLIQSALVLIMGLALTAQIIVFFGHSSPTFIFPSLQLNTIEQIFLDTGYLYIIYFGFQEILVVARESREEDYIISFRKFRKFRITNDIYVPAAMAITVVTSASFNILFALSVLYLSPSASITQVSIPAIYLANEFGGSAWEVILSITFLIASVTTLVPAFLAASRHIGSMSRDGFLPVRVSRGSYLIVLVLILVLYFQSSAFLIGITDFMILVSLGINSFGLYWLLKLTRTRNTIWKIASVIVGGSCIALGFSVYFITRSVVESGIIAVFITYLLYDALELGSIGSQLFLVIGSAILAMVTFSFPMDFGNSILPQLSVFNSILNSGSLPIYLSFAAFLLILNIFIDTFLIRKYDILPTV